MNHVPPWKLAAEVLSRNCVLWGTQEADKLAPILALPGSVQQNAETPVFATNPWCLNPANQRSKGKSDRPCQTAETQRWSFIEKTERIVGQNWHRFCPTERTVVVAVSTRFRFPLPVILTVQSTKIPLIDRFRRWLAWCELVPPVPRDAHPSPTATQEGQVIKYPNLFCGKPRHAAGALIHGGRGGLPREIVSAAMSFTPIALQNRDGRR